MKRALPGADTVKAAIDTVLDQAAATGRRPTVSAVERHLGIPHATFHRHYSDLIDTHFRPRIPETAPPALGETTSERTETNLHRLRQENTDLRRTLALYEEAIRQLTLENAALRQGATARPRPARPRTELRCVRSVPSNARTRRTFAGLPRRRAPQPVHAQ
ncbi:hypothetical protein ACFWBB_30190 [Streptomyces sp. NPDC060000]|uniref:hypothetical protein n=1 Tax=Streptomyces sp. NPDC060000 TaxID=3347031 RepID=UPI0036AE4390